MKISVSMLSSYLFCSRKLFLEQVLALKEPPKKGLVLGKIRHEIYDFINDIEEKLVKSIIERMDFQNIGGLYKKNYLQKVREIIIKNKSNIREVNLDILEVFKKTWPYICYESELRSRNIFEFILENKVYGKQLWEALTPKIVSELKIESNKLQLKGILDRVEIYEHGYVPIELKTGKTPKQGVWPGHRVQIAAYALLLEEKFYTKIKEGYINYLDSKQLRHIAINSFMKEEIKNLVEEIQALLGRRELPNYCQNRNKCVNCGLRGTCYNEGEVDNLMSGILQES